MTSSPASRMASRITLRQLQIFEAVARLGSFTAAARELHVTQPTVSMQISKLCEQLELTLLEQVGREVRLTADGRKVYEVACDIIARTGMLGELATSLKGEVQGDLRIASVTTATYFLPRLLGAFIKRYPRVEPFLSVTNRTQVIERLRNGSDDLIIMGRAPQELDVVAHAFLDNDLVVAVASTHPLAVRQGRIPLKALTEERFLMREPGSGTRLAVETLLAEHGLSVRPAMELGSTEAVKQAVLAGLGVSVLPRHAIERALTAGDVVVLDVEHFPLRRKWYAVHLKGRRLSLAAQQFLDYLCNDATSVLDAAASNTGGSAQD